MQSIELKIPPPIVAFLVAAAMWGASRYGPAMEAPLLYRAIVALAIAGAGAAIAATAARAFRRAGTTVNPMRPEATSSLVITGMHRYSRNPMYLGLLLVLIGWAAFLCAAWPVLGPPLFVLYIGRFQIAPEERVLAARFGDAYAEYKTKVRRWL